MQRLITTLLAAALLSFAGNTLAADDVTRCGSKQLKADAKWQKALGKESIKACVSGAQGNPGPINEDKVVKATQKFNDTLVKLEDKFGDANCFRGEGSQEDVDDALDRAAFTADQLCQVEDN